MNIQGMQKLTLLDFPGKIACTVFTAGCDLRCPFCHNSFLVINPPAETKFSRDDVFSFLKKRVGVLDGVAITGGEPLMQPDIEEFIAGVKELGFLVKLDTNGTFPKSLKRIVDNELVDYIAMDVKSSPKGYSQCVGIANYNIDKINESIGILLNGNVDYEFRTTVAKGLHEPYDIEEIGKWIKGAKRHFLQKFEDSGDLIGFGLEPFKKEEMIAFRETIRRYVPECDVRGI